MHSSYKGPNLAWTIKSYLWFILDSLYFFWHKTSNFLHVMAMLQTEQNIARKAIFLQCMFVIKTNQKEKLGVPLAALTLGQQNRQGPGLLAVVLQPAPHP